MVVWEEGVQPTIHVTPFYSRVYTSDLCLGVKNRVYPKSRDQPVVR